MDKSKKAFATNILRRGFFRYYSRWQADKRSKLSSRNQYYCENPECGVIGGKKDFQLDHVIPCVLTSGWDSFDGFIDRLYCEPSGLMRLCLSCHESKTQSENAQRPNRVKKKVKKKKKKT